MFRDNNLLMDSKVVVSTNAATGSYIDFLAAGDAMDFGDVMVWRVLVTTSAVTAVTGKNLTFQLQTSPNSLFDSNAITLASVAVDLANLKAQTAGAAPPVNAVGNPISPAVVNVLLPPGMLRFCRGYYVYDASSSFVTGPIVNNELVMDIDKLIGPTLGVLIK